MIINDGYRKIKYAVVDEIELNENMSDHEIDEYFEGKFDGKQITWCDADEEIFE